MRRSRLRRLLLLVQRSKCLHPRAVHRAWPHDIPRADQRAALARRWLDVSDRRTTGLWEFWNLVCDGGRLRSSDEPAHGATHHVVEIEDGDSRGADVPEHQLVNQWPRRRVAGALDDEVDEGA